MQAASRNNGAFFFKTYQLNKIIWNVNIYKTCSICKCNHPVLRFKTQNPIDTTIMPQCPPSSFHLCFHLTNECNCWLLFVPVFSPIQYQHTHRLIHSCGSSDLHVLQQSHRNTWRQKSRIISKTYFTAVTNGNQDRFHISTYQDPREHGLAVRCIRLTQTMFNDFLIQT